MKITEPLIGKRIRLEHRLVFPPMATRSSDNGIPRTETIDHYREIAENRLLGLMITEHSYIDMQGKADPHQASFASDDVIAAQSAMTSAIHRANPTLKLFAQLNHAGAYTSTDVTGMPLVSASPVQLKEEPCRALTVDEIRYLEYKFMNAAVRVKKSGYDGVEIHCAHGYLLNQFYSPLVNHRTDQYGPQTLENRLRFLIETIRLVRSAVGPDYPVAVRLGGADYLPGGSTLEDACGAARILAQEDIDLIDLSGGMCRYTREGVQSPGYFSDMSAAVKKCVSLPVLVTGGIHTPEQAEALILDGKADLVGVGRALFKDPKWGID
jgi:NADPH2 dehydrogenase